LQSANSKNEAVARMEFGCWSLKFPWLLGLGIWSFAFSAYAASLESHISDPRALLPDSRSLYSLCVHCNSWIKPAQIVQRSRSQHRHSVCCLDGVGSRASAVARPPQLCVHQLSRPPVRRSRNTY